MLILSRKRKEQIVIGDDIIVEVVEIQSSGKVRLGVIAPKDVPVHRLEVYVAIHGQAPKEPSP